MLNHEQPDIIILFETGESIQKKLFMPHDNYSV